MYEYYAKTQSQMREQIEQSRLSAPCRSERIPAQGADLPEAKAPKPTVPRIKYLVVKCNKCALNSLTHLHIDTSPYSS